MKEPTTPAVPGTLEDVYQRLGRLESKVFGDAAVPPPVVTPVPVPVPPPSKPTPPPAPAEPLPPPVKVEPKPEPVPEPKPAPKPHVEISISKVLNVLGVGFVVVAATFAVMYSWQFLGPWFKVSAGLGVSALLIALGERLSRRSTNQWYGQGLAGGGWSLAYFVVYAMQNIASVKVLDSVMLDCTLLITLAAGCMAHAMKKRSEVMAILSTVLAFVTISLSTITAFSVVAFAVLVIGVGTVIVRMNWTRVLACSVVGSYVTFTIFTQPQIASNALTPEGGLALSGAFLALFWLAHNAVAFLLGEKTSKPGIVSGLTVLNAIAFVGLGLNALGDAGMESYRYAFLLTTGLVYLGVTPLFARRGHVLPLVTCLVGLVCASAAVPLKFNQEATNAVWLLETALLVWAGLRFNLISFRWFASALSALLAVSVVSEIVNSELVVNIGSFTVEWRVLIGLLTATVFGACSYIYRRPQFATILRSYEKDISHQAYFVASAAILWLLPAMTASDAARPLFWLVEGAVLLALARRSSDVVKHAATGLFFLSASVVTVYMHTAVPPLIALAVITATALVGLSYRFDKAIFIANPIKLEEYRAYLLAAGASCLLYTALHLGLSEATPVLALEVGALFALALALRDRWLAIASTAAFAVVGLSAISSYSGDNWTWLFILPVAAIGYSVSAVFARLAGIVGGYKGSEFCGNVQVWSSDEAATLRSLFGVASSVVLAATFATLLSGPAISIAWAVQGLVLIGVGFRFKDKFYEGCGLGIFALLVGKLLFVDLAGASSIQRILSFLVTGVAFLLGAYAYAWIRKSVARNGDNDKSK